MTPTQHGYKQCQRCHCWRPEPALELGVCKDWPTCAQRKNGATGPEVPK